MFDVFLKVLGAIFAKPLGNIIFGVIVIFAIGIPIYRSQDTFAWVIVGIIITVVGILRIILNVILNSNDSVKEGSEKIIMNAEENFDKAIEDFSEAIKLEPGNPLNYIKRGISYRNKKEFDLAIADFNAAINIEPNKYGFFYFERSLAYIIKGEKNLAISDIEMAIKIDPENKDYREALNDIKAA